MSQGSGPGGPGCRRAGVRDRAQGTKVTWAWKAWKRLPGVYRKDSAIIPSLQPFSERPFPMGAGRWPRECVGNVMVDIANTARTSRTATRS